MFLKFTVFVGNVAPQRDSIVKKVITGLILGFVLGCGGGHDHDHDHDHGGGSHGHEAPHGGILVNVDNEFCHLEFLREPGTKRLLMHAMRFHPEGVLKFYNEKISVTAKLGEEIKSFELLPMELDGVTATKEPTSLYVAEIDWLNDGVVFRGNLGDITIEGKTLKNISFQYSGK